MTTNTAIPAGYAIEQVDLHEADDRLIDRVVAFWHAMDAEAVPEDPPMPAEGLVARLRTRSQFGDRTDWIASSGDEVVGRIAVFENKSGSNEHIREVMLHVHPEHRRRGIGSALFSSAMAAIPDDGKTKLVAGWTTNRVPAGMAFAERLVAKKGMHMRVSQVYLRAIDRALIREWANVQPAGYHLEFVENDIPDALMPAMLQAFTAINRMPREDLEMEDWKFTAETIRDWERQRTARGQVQWMLLAIEDATGAGAGFTNVVFDPRIEAVVHQGGTAVDPAHQGRDIGKWLKATMVERILADLPKARFIRTDNAGTNAPMLAINDRMGFREAWWMDIWQMPLADAKAYAEARGL
ncbi:MAG: GNAT family N-acetyltransferase [Chloroflexi bacterium]|nr:GNAT family N-acetyltransferase [Chloroflexota bacterium]